MPELMRSDDCSGSETNMRSSCSWLGDHRTDLVETTPEEDWWRIEFPTTSSPSSSTTCSDHRFQVLAKSSSSKPGSSGGHSSTTLFSCFRHSPAHMTDPGCNLEPKTPPRSEVVLIQPSSSRRANCDVTEVDPAMENSHRGCSTAYESDQLHMYSDEEPTSPVVNCIGQVRPKKKPKHIAKRNEPGAVRNSNERATLHSLQLASPRSWSGGKWKQMLQLAPIPQASHN